MRDSWKFAWAACLASAVAFADGPAAPQSGLYVGPEVGTNLLDFNWPGGSSYGTEFTPSARLTLFSPRFALGGDVGLSTSLAPFSGFYDASLNLGGEVMPYLTTWGSTRTYGVGGLNLGVQLAANPNPTSSGAFPKVGFTLGVGVQHFLAPALGIAAEAGLRTQFIFGSSVEPTTSLYVSMVGLFDPWSWMRAAVPEVPGPPSLPPTPPKPPEPPPAPPSPPPLYGRSKPKPCSTYATDGWFEPTQGVWQDDPSFEDQPTKQLTRLPGSGIAYEAELNLSVNRDTVLFGVHHYRKDGETVVVDDRSDIVLKGFSNCTVKIPVKFEFTNTDTLGSATLYTSQLLDDVPLEGRAAPEFTPWKVTLPVPTTGLPLVKPFRFLLNTFYKLKAELVRPSGAATGLLMTVKGYAQPTEGPMVHFVPVLLSQTTLLGEGILVTRTQNLANDTEKYVPDLFPIAPEGLPTSVKVIRNFSDQGIGSKWFPSRGVSAMVAALNDTLAATTFLDGAGRVVAVMRFTDFDVLFDGALAGRALPNTVDVVPKGPGPAIRKQGRSLSWKVIVMPDYASWEDVAHELVHTLPGGWSGTEMKKECGKDYHDKKDPVAHGVKIDDGGALTMAMRRVMDSKLPLMGPLDTEEDIWITQCTYWHLLNELRGGPPDPPVVMLRAWIGKKGLKVVGELKPLYDLMGHSDLASGKGGPFAFVLKDAKGAELGRFPFTPQFSDIETGQPRDLVSVVYRVPDLPGWAQVELVGPGGVLDHRALSAKAPELTITSPADSAQVTPDNGKIHVAWQAQGEPGATLLYSVLYSSDGGKNWLDQAFEQKETSFDLQIAPKGTAHQVKIIVTDGTRSAEAVTRFVPSP